MCAALCVWCVGVGACVGVVEGRRMCVCVYIISKCGCVSAVHLWLEL